MARGPVVAVAARLSGRGFAQGRGVGLGAAAHAVSVFKVIWEEVFGARLQKSTQTFPGHARVKNLRKHEIVALLDLAGIDRAGRDTHRELYRLLMSHKARFASPKYSLRLPKWGRLLGFAARGPEPGPDAPPKPRWKRRSHASRLCTGLAPRGRSTFARFSRAGLCSSAVALPPSLPRHAGFAQQRLCVRGLALFGVGRGPRPRARAARPTLPNGRRRLRRQVRPRKRVCAWRDRARARRERCNGRAAGGPRARRRRPRALPLATLGHAATWKALYVSALAALRAQIGPFRFYRETRFGVDNDTGLLVSAEEPPMPPTRPRGRPCCARRYGWP